MTHGCVRASNKAFFFSFFLVLSVSCMSHTMIRQDSCKLMDIVHVCNHPVHDDDDDRIVRTILASKVESSEREREREMAATKTLREEALTVLLLAVPVAATRLLVRVTAMQALFFVGNFAPDGRLAAAALAQTISKYVIHIITRARRHIYIERHRERERESL